MNNSEFDFKKLVDDRIKALALSMEQEQNKMTKLEKISKVASVDVWKNTKIKTYSNGKKKTVYSKVACFKSTSDVSDYDCKWKDREYFDQKHIDKWNEYREVHNIPKNLESYAEYQFFKNFWFFEDLKNHPERVIDYSDKAVYRKKTKIFDYVYNNDWDYFLTLTVNYSQYGWTAKEYSKKVQKWLNNLQQRQGIEYLLVAEYHKNSDRIHLHALVKGSGEALGLVESGTYLFRGSRFDKPIFADTAQRNGLDIANGQVVYNVTKWKYGFSTAIKTDDNKKALSGYITKYITKELQRIFGKSYWHSKGVTAPVVSYEDTTTEKFDEIVADFQPSDYFKYCSDI